MVRFIPHLDVSLTVPLILLLAARGLAGEASDPQPASPPSRNETEVHADCSRCKSSGRITCPTCKGAGNIHKVCAVCNGKGRRPCPQCAAGSPPGGNGSVTPGASNRGRILCLACSGRGTLEGNSDRPCFRCRGSREQACPTCIGRGDLSCPKTRYVGTCSTCGFVGKVPCPSCQEDSPVEDSPASPSEFNGRRESNDKGAAKSRARSGSKGIEEDEPTNTSNATATSPAQQDPYTEARFQADQKSLAAKWEVLGKDMEVVRGLFAKNTTEKLRKTKSELLRLARDADSLGDSGHAPARDLGRRAREGVKRIEPLETAWSRLDSRYDRLQAQFKTALNLWQGQPRWSLDLPQGDQEAAQDKLAFLGQAIDLTSKSASRLREEKPEKTSQGIEEVEAGSIQIRRELERTREVSRKARTAAPGSNSKLGLAGRSPAEGRDEPPPGRTSEESSSSGRQLDRLKNDEVEVSRARDSEDDSSLNEGSAPQATQPAGGSWKLVAVLGALLAATLCAVAYLLADRRRSSKDGK